MDAKPNVSFLPPFLPSRFDSHFSSRDWETPAKDVCKRDLKALVINTATWEALASDRSAWRQEAQNDLSSYEDTLTLWQSYKKKERKKRERPQKVSAPDRQASLDILLC